MNPVLLTVVQGVFTYILLWWVVFFVSLQWAVPDFRFRLPWTRRGQIVYLSRRSFHPVVRKLIASCLITLVVWCAIFPLVKSDYSPLKQWSYGLDDYARQREAAKPTS